MFSSLPQQCERRLSPSTVEANSVLSVDGQDGHSDHLSSRSRKWELEGSCYQAPSFLLVLHEAKPKPCVCFSPCGPAQFVCKCCGCLNNPSSHYCYLKPSSVRLSLRVLEGSWVESYTILPLVPAPLLICALSQSFYSTFTARLMWLRKYSSLSQRPWGISLHLHGKRRVADAFIV